ncbi:MAG: hypothetical protein HN855_01355 [Anaerolineae bacterium]|jgi:hypothetical protein|nr:hypothetical protein [Anaerolineae bacterium]MBT7072784.1 hypothetical protein [Anaerolineae bacterium]MBT7323787.1 hypothetical protein [Anaerolineae bacterium]
MSETERTPKEILTEIHTGLRASKAEERQESLTALNTLAYSSGAILRELEKMALSDRSKAVRETALETLQTPLYRQLQTRQARLPQHSRRMIVDEIAIWEKDGLLDESRSQILRQRYDFDLKPAPVDQKSALSQPQPAKPKATLAQTLFSETSIKVALYLGAFFIVAAAAIFAAIFEALRLPILLLFTLIFGGGSLVLKKKLPQPSFTLFIIFSVLLPIDFSVIADTLILDGQGISIYWMIVYLLMTGVWAFATWFFRSRFFSLMALVSVGVSLFYLANLFNDPPVDLYLLLLSLSGLGSLGAVKLLKKWQDEQFALPLFWLTQAQEIVLLMISFFAFLFHYDDPSFENVWWLATSAIWYLGAAFYLLSNWIKKNLVFRALVIMCMMPLAWLFINTFDANENAQAVSFLVWGVLFALSGEALGTRKEGKFHEYGQLLILGAAPLVGLSALLGLAQSENMGFLLSLSVAILYTLLNVYRSRLWMWAYALVATLAAYFLFYELDFMRNREFFYGFKLLIPALLLLLPDMIFKNDFMINLSWRLPPRLLGAGLVLVNTIAILDVSNENLWKTALIFGIYALLGMGYALRYFPEYAYIASAAFVLMLVYILRNQAAEHWIVPLISLAVIFYFVGVGLARFEREKWARVYIISGLVLGTLVALSVPFEDLGVSKSIVVVIAAGLFTIEAFRKRNLWLGFPANALYLMAYFMILLNFEIDQPQFYSVAAAGLGMLMHYLLVRAGSKTSAFVTGMLSQLILLSTTYIQMLSEGEFVYFVVLFFQALAVLIYGIVIRSRSMVVTPIIFLVLGVLTIALNLLGELSIFLIGCTGIFLLLFGIGALILRERFAELREQLDDWNA